MHKASKRNEWSTSIRLTEAPAQMLKLLAVAVEQTRMFQRCFEPHTVSSIATIVQNYHARFKLISVSVGTGSPVIPRRTDLDLPMRQETALSG